MTFNCYKIQIFSEFCVRSHFWEVTTAKRMKIHPHCRSGIVAHWKYFSTMYRLRCYCWAIVSGGRCSELRPIQQSCRAFTFALARLSCLIQWQSGDGGKSGGDAEKNGAVQGHQAYHEFWERQNYSPSRPPITITHSMIWKIEIMNLRYFKFLSRHYSEVSLLSEYVSGDSPISCFHSSCCWDWVLCFLSTIKACNR